MKSKTTTMVLAFFLGGIGVHRFYLGKIVTGILYFLFSWTFIPAFVALIEFFYYWWLTDEEFNELYNKGLVMTQYSYATPKTHNKCPACAELVLKEAIICKHCGAQLEGK